MPGHNRVRLHDDQGVHPARPQTAEGDPKRSVKAAQARTWLLTLEHHQLLAKRGNLQAETVTAGEERAPVGEHREDERCHPSIVLADIYSSLAPSC